MPPGRSRPPCVSSPMLASTSITRTAAPAKAPRLPPWFWASRTRYAAPPSGDERAHVGNCRRPLPRVLIRHVPRDPLRIEFLLVKPQALKVVPGLAVLEQQVREAFARVCALKLTDARKRRHAEIEAFVPLILSVKKERDEQEVHRAWTFSAIPH